jgi:phospholipase C
VPAGGYEAPTIFDRLQSAGVPWKVYVENYDPRMTRRGPNTGPLAGQTTRLPLLDIDRIVDDPRMFSHVADLAEYDRDLRTGTLPAVSYVVPAGSAENPPSRVGAGQDLVRRLTSELARSSAWPRSAFFWTYDAWGGWYDHVPPPRVDEHGFGFRVPALMMSPFSPRGAVDHTTLDHTAILRFIEDNWGLAPLGPRDAASPGLAAALDFGHPARPPELPSPTHVVPPVRAAPQGLIYGAYGVAVLLAAVLALVASRTRPGRREAT